MGGGCEHVGGVWVACGRGLGSMWEGFGEHVGGGCEHVGGVWVACGRGLGSMWEGVVSMWEGFG